MSRLFALGNYIETNNAAGLTGTPLTLSYWFKKTAGATANTLALDKISGNEYHINYITDSAISIFSLSTIGGTNGTGTKTGSGTAAWFHGASVIASDVSRIAYLNGVAGTANTTSVTPTGFDNISIGSSWKGSRDPDYVGSLAEIAIWTAALTADEIVSLFKGFSPRHIRPQSRVPYAPLIRDLVELGRGLTLTASGTTVADHPRIYA